MKLKRFRYDIAIDKVLTLMYNEDRKQKQQTKVGSTMQVNATFLAQRYLDGIDATEMLMSSGFAGDFRVSVTNAFNAMVEKTGLKIEYVDFQPYDSVADMHTKVYSTNVLQISTQFNNSELLGEDVNLQFRALHDLCHLECSNLHEIMCSFELSGETRAFAYQCDMQNVDTLTKQVLFSEIVLQAATYYHLGDFAEQKVVLIAEELINLWVNTFNANL